MDQAFPVPPESIPDTNRKAHIMMRISRGNEVIGNRSVNQVKRGIANASLLLTDFYYHEELSEWLPLADFLTRVAEQKIPKQIGPPCYCGSNLPFQVCHGDGSLY
jgi:hypothetical protein